MLKIGLHQHVSRVIVAPMAGVTDKPFRSLCRSLGSHWIIGEMMTSDSRLWHTSKSQFRLQYHDEPAPRWVQIAGAEPAMMAEAARFNEARGAQIVDINMGCPAKKVCNRAAGSALLRDERLVGRILEAVVNAVDVPVTLKMRLGWSMQERNAVGIARLAESVGVQLITVHGRTRACKFEGEVDYRSIGEVRAAIDIPVVANGDIDSPVKARDVLDLTGCDAVMIGRAAQGRPWLPAHIDHYLQTDRLKKNPGPGEIRRLLVAHISRLHEFYGEARGVRIARKHVGWYLCGLGMEEFRSRFNRLASADAQIEAVDEALTTTTNEATTEATTKADAKAA